MVREISYFKLLLDRMVGDPMVSVSVISAREVELCVGAEEEANDGTLYVIPKISKDFHLASQGKDGNQGRNRESLGLA